MDSILYAYDVAIRTLAYTRFGSLLGINTLAGTQSEAINLGVVIAPKRIAKRELSEKRGEDFLEFINVYRVGQQFSWPRQRTVVSRRGLKYQDSNGHIGRISADPIDLVYQMYFWSVNLDRVGQCAEKYIKWQHDSPKVSITFNDSFTLNPDIWITPIEDDSTIEDVFNTGKIWCYRMSVSVDAWIPHLDSDASNVQIEKIQLTTYDRDDVETLTTIYVNDANQDTDLESALRMFRSKLYRILDVSSTDKTFQVSNDRSSEFSSGDIIFVENSTDNNQYYTVVSTTYSEDTDRTTITVSESIASDTADGNIYKPE